MRFTYKTKIKKSVDIKIMIKLQYQCVKPRPCQAIFILIKYNHTRTLQFIYAKDKNYQQAKLNFKGKSS